MLIAFTKTRENSEHDFRDIKPPHICRQSANRIHKEIYVQPKPPHQADCKGHIHKGGTFIPKGDAHKQIGTHAVSRPDIARDASHKRHN